MSDEETSNFMDEIPEQETVITIKMGKVLNAEEKKKIEDELYDIAYKYCSAISIEMEEEDT